MKCVLVSAIKNTADGARVFSQEGDDELADTDLMAIA